VRPLFSNPGDNPARMSTSLRQSSPMTKPTYTDTGVWNQANAQTVEMRRSHEDTGTETPINGWDHIPPKPSMAVGRWRWDVAL
jgi:hypothetical protein